LWLCDHPLVEIQKLLTEKGLSLPGHMLGLSVHALQHILTQHTLTLMQAGIGFFCVVFAVNLAIHSYLVLRYADGNKGAVNVGFDYMSNMSNAAGRLTGTMMLGVLYTYAGAGADGFGWCFVRSALLLMLCCGVTKSETTRRDWHAGPALSASATRRALLACQG
jgi:hypothetical protein